MKLNKSGVGGGGLFLEEQILIIVTDNGGSGLGDSLFPLGRSTRSLTTEWWALGCDQRKH